MFFHTTHKFVSGTKIRLYIDITKLDGEFFFSQKSFHCSLLFLLRTTLEQIVLAEGDGVALHGQALFFGLGQAAVGGGGELTDGGGELLTDGLDGCEVEAAGRVGGVEAADRVGAVEVVGYLFEEKQQHVGAQLLARPAWSVGGGG